MIRLHLLAIFRLLQILTMQYLLVLAILCQAAARGDLVELKRLIEEKNYDPNDSDYDGRTALHIASGEGTGVTMF